MSDAQQSAPYPVRPGDRVRVVDPALDALAAIFREATGEEPPPNNVGTVEEIHPAEAGVCVEAMVVICFDDGESSAPYPLSEVEVIHA